MESANPPAVKPASQEAFALTTSRGFSEWLARTRASLVFTT